MFTYRTMYCVHFRFAWPINNIEEIQNYLDDDNIAKYADESAIRSVKFNVVNDYGGYIFIKCHGIKINYIKEIQEFLEDQLESGIGDSFRQQDFSQLEIDSHYIENEMCLTGDVYKVD